MKKITFILAAIFIGIIMMTAVACGNKDPYDPDNFIADTTSAKIVKEKVTIKLFAPRNNLTVQDWNQMRLFKELEEETNIHIDWHYGDINNYDNARSNEWSSTRNRADAFFLWNTVPEQIRYANSNTIMSIDSLINDYMPNYKALVNDNPEMAKAAKLLDGKMYSTVLINSVPRDWTFKQYINKTWILQALSSGKLSASDVSDVVIDGETYKLPTNLDQFYNVLKAFKEMGYTPISSVGIRNTLRSFLMSGFGEVTSGLRLDAEGKVIFVQQKDVYREYLKFASKLYSENLIDNNIFNKTQETDLIAIGSTLGCFDNSSAYNIVGKNKDTDYVALPPLTGGTFSSNREQVWLDFDNKFDPTGIMIPKDSKYSREIARWLDRLYSPKYIEIQAFGKEGTDWDWDDAEKTSFTFNVPASASSIESFRGTLTPGVGLGTIAYWNGNFVLKENNPTIQRINSQVKAYTPYLTIPFPKDVKLTAAQSSSISTILVDLNNYTTEFEKDCINGTKDINTDSVWTNFKSGLNQIGIATYLSVYQEAYNNYIS